MPDPGAAVVVRRARSDDSRAVAALVYSTSSGLYDHLLKDRERAVGFIEATFRRKGSGAGRELTWVAECEGEVAGALVGFPAGAAAGLARRFAWMVLRHTPPWRWPAVVRLQWLGERQAPRPVAASFYVDALATDPGHRRRGVATALLERAEKHARAVGLRALSVDTPESNAGGLALYRSAGFSVVERVDTKPPIPRAVLLAKDLK